MAALNVFLNSIHLGILESLSTGLSFNYTDEWLSRENAFPISRSLPLREDLYKGPEVISYFDNLLPDNVSMRQRIALQMGADSESIFDLLAVIGRDCVGALQFISPDLLVKIPNKVISRNISDKQIAEKLRNLKSIPLANSDEEEIRLSIAGAQEKTAFLFYNGKWQIPSGSTPTTHIFKPKSDHFPDSVENEWLCSRIVNAFGVPIANCQMQQFEDIKVLVVERFDRKWVNDSLIRLPQEDLCQALNIPSYKKYQSDGGPDIVRIMDLLNESSRRDQDRDLFMKTQIIYFLLAAIDGHAKNYSISWSPTGFELTPVYDVLSAQPLVDTGNFQSQKIKMAMSAGDNHHYKVREILGRHYIQTAKKCRYHVTLMENLLESIYSRIPDVIEDVGSQLGPDFPMEVAESIFRGILARADSLLNSTLR